MLFCPSTTMLSIYTILLVACTQVHGQLTGEQKILRQKAWDQAAQLWGNATADSYDSRRVDAMNGVQIAASRIEFHLNKLAASERWADKQAPPVERSSNSSDSADTMRRTLKAEGCGELEESSTGRGLLAFRASSSCKVQRNKNFVAGFLKFKKGVKKWQDCCKLCSQTAGCVGWTLNTGAYNRRVKTNKRGCYLKKKGYKVKKNKAGGYISGTMTLSRDINTGGSNTNTVASPSPVNNDYLAWDPSIWDNFPSPDPIVEEPTPEQSPPAFEYGESPGDDPFSWVPPIPPAEYWIPPSKPSPPPVEIPVRGDRKAYAKVLGLSWQFYQAQRSGHTDPGNRVPWRSDSHLNDPVVGGLYDAGDTLKLNFALASTIANLAWGILEFKTAYVEAATLNYALTNLRNGAQYLLDCHDRAAGTYVGQIGDPNVDHNYWGRPEQERGARPAYVYKPGMGAADLFGTVSAALTASSLVFAKTDATFAGNLMESAKVLYRWGTENPGKYSDFHKKQTFSIYPSADWPDNMAWAAGWMYRATKDSNYLDQASRYFTMAKNDVYPGWDSFWAPHAIHMITLADQGINVPGIDTYRAFGEAKFLRAWLQADGFCEIISTPRGLHYPKWNEWANLQFSTTSASLALFHAKYTRDATKRFNDITFAQKQVEYAMGIGSLRSYVVGYGHNPPTQPHHAAASCRDMPAPCNWDDESKPGPNGHVIYGAMVAGPGGVRKNAANPDDSYTDKRRDYVTNEVANDYNAGFTNALAGLYQLTAR